MKKNPLILLLCPLLTLVLLLTPTLAWADGEIDFSEVEIGWLSSVFYTGEPAYPSHWLTYQDEQLVEGVDYWVSYKTNSWTDETVDPVEVGWYYVFYHPMGRFTGSVSDCRIYEIQDPYDIKNMYLSRIIPNYEYDGLIHNGYPETIGTYDVTLHYGTDFVVDHYELAVYDKDEGVSYPSDSGPVDPIEPGRYYCYLRGIGSYHGTKDVLFDIYSRYDLTYGHASISSQSIAGEAIRPVPTLYDVRGNQLTEGVDFRVKGYLTWDDRRTKSNYLSAIDQPGEYFVVIEGIGDYTDTRYDYVMVTTTKSISDAVVTVGECWYEGAPVEPTLDVSLMGTTLTRGTDYSVSYEDAQGRSVSRPDAAGTWWVILNGTGTYQGTKRQSFVVKSDTGRYDELLSQLNEGLTTAKAGVSTAQQTQQQAATALDAAQKAYDAAGTDYAAAKSEADAKQQALSAANDQLATKKTAQQTADAAVAANATDIANAQATLTAAQGEEATKQEAVNAAGTRVSTAQAQVDQCQQALSDAQAAVAEVIQGGSVGFFEAMGSTLAASYLTDTSAVEGDTGTTYASHTTIGGETDATSLDNMMAALDWIDYCNELRAAEGLPALKVTDGMMASAQRNANFSTYSYNHAVDSNGYMDVADMTGLAWAENLYFTVLGCEDAYDGWYYDEKETWEEIVSQHPEVESLKPSKAAVCHALGVTSLGIGHYFNIINPSYTVTGVGLNSDPTLNSWYIGRGAAIQQFMKASDSSGTAYTVEEYRQRLTAYYDSSDVEEAQAALDGAQQDLATATQAQTDAAAQLSVAQQATQAARDALAAEQAKTAGLTSAATQAASAVRTEESKVAAAQKAYNDAKAKVDALDADGSIARLSQQLDRAKTDKQAADEALTKAQGSVTTAQQRLDNASNLGADVVMNGIVDKPYTGSAQTQDITATKTFEGKAYTLTEGSHFTLAYAHNDQRGTATITLSGVGQKGSGKTWGSSTANFAIVAVDLSGARVTAANQTYTGSSLTPAVEVTLGNKKLSSADYTVSYDKNQNAGTATITVSGRGNYTGQATGSFAIARADISAGAIDPVSDQYFNESPKEPSVVVRVGGRVLSGGTDYDASYTNNVSAGTASVTVQGKGNYQGSLKASFAIRYFADVIERDGGTPHWQDILWLAQQGVSKGWTVNGGVREFRGGLPVVRQDMAAFLYRLAGSPAYEPSAADKRMFSDVTDKTPHAKEIWWMASVGISKGWAMPDGTRQFRGGEQVKRQDMAAFLRRLGTYMGVNTALPAGYRNPFADVTTKTPHYEDVLWLASSGVSAGWTVSGHKEFRGDNTVKRQDMAAFLHRLYNLA